MPSYPSHQKIKPHLQDVAHMHICIELCVRHPTHAKAIEAFYQTLLDHHVLPPYICYASHEETPLILSQLHIMHALNQALRPYAAIEQFRDMNDATQSLATAGLLNEQTFMILMTHEFPITLAGTMASQKKHKPFDNTGDYCALGALSFEELVKKWGLLSPRRADVNTSYETPVQARNTPFPR